MAGESHGDPVNLAAGEASAAIRMRLKQTDSKLLLAIEDVERYQRALKLVALTCTLSKVAWTLVDGRW